VISVQTITEFRSAVKKLIDVDVAVPASVISASDASPRHLLDIDRRRSGRCERLGAGDELGVGAERRAEHPEEREQAHEQQQDHRGPGRDAAPGNPLRDAHPGGRCTGQLGGRRVRG
jgi:hypothetical protein